MNAAPANRWPISLVVVFAFAAPRASRAEQTFAYKYADYRESDGRVSVQTQSMLLESDLGSAWHAKVTGTLDAIAVHRRPGSPPHLAARRCHSPR